MSKDMEFLFKLGIYCRSQAIIERLVLKQTCQWLQLLSCINVVYGQENTVNKEIELWAKKGIIKSTVWTAALNAETWILTEAKIENLEAFEMWTWRRMLKISWTEKVTNEEVMVCASEARSILKVIWRWWLGHVLRHDNLLHDIIEGKMLDKATWGRKGWSYCMIWWKGEIIDSWKI